MPRLNRRTKRRIDGYTQAQIEELLTGFEFIPGTGFDCDEAKRAAWEELREPLLRRWVKDNPGTRPHAWWLYDAPERRRRVDGVQHPFDNRKRKEYVAKWAADYPREAEQNAYRLSYGKPNAFCVSDDFTAEYETEAEFLQRLGLLTGAERQALEDAAFNTDDQ